MTTEPQLARRFNTGEEEMELRSIFERALPTPGSSSTPTSLVPD